MTHWLHPVFFFVKEAWIIFHEADKPDPVGNFSDADILAPEHRTQVDLVVANANPAASGYPDGPIVKRLLQDFRVAVLACRGCIHFARVFPVKGLMRPVVIVTFDKSFEPALLLQKIVAGWLCRLLLECQVHPLVAPVLLGMDGFDAFDSDTRPQPPDRKSTQAELGMRRGERHTVVGSDCRRETKRLESAFKYRESPGFPGGLQSFAGQQIA